MINSKWEVTIIELKNGKRKYKVTRRMPGLHVAETKIFTSKKKALEQLYEWIG